MKLITKKYKKYKNKTLKQKGGAITNEETLKEIKFVEDFFKIKRQGKPQINNTEFNEDEDEKIITGIFNNYKSNNLNVKLICPKYHGRTNTNTNNVDIFREVPKNTIFCFLTLLGSLGTSEINTKNIEDYLKTLKKREMEKILFNLGRLTEIEKYDPVLKYEDLYLFMKCFKFSTWYYPGQKYIDMILSPGVEDICARYTIMFKKESNNSAKGAYSKHKDSFRFKNLSEYIKDINIVNDETINIYFFESCRGINVLDPFDTDIKNSVSKLFEYEYKIYVINKNIIKKLHKEKPDFKREFPHITPECCSSSLVHAMLEKEDENDRDPVLYNDDFRYNRKNEFIINLYNKVIIGLKPTKEDIITFISLSFKKQIFLINKLDNLGTKEIKIKTLEYIWRALLNKDIYINIFFQNINSFSNLQDNKDSNILYDNLNDDLDDPFYIYNEHLKQYKTLFEKEGFNFPYFDEYYKRDVRKYDITDFSNISMKMLIPNQYKLFFNNIKNIIISKKINDYDIINLIKNIDLLINLETITFYNKINVYENYLANKSYYLKNLKMIVLNGGALSSRCFLKTNMLLKNIRNFNIIHLICKIELINLTIIKCIFDSINIINIADEDVNTKNLDKLELNIDNCLLNKGIIFDFINNLNTITNIIIKNTVIKFIKNNNENHLITFSNFIFNNQKEFPTIENIKIENLHFINSYIDNFIYNEILETLIITDPIGSLINIKKLKYKKLKFVGDKFEYKDYKDCPINFNYLERIDISESKFIKSSFIKHFKISYYNLRPGLIVY